MTNPLGSDIIQWLSGKTRYAQRNLGVAQLGARYLGVVEAAGSSPVTQIKIRYLRMSDLFVFYFLRDFSKEFYKISQNHLDKTFPLCYNIKAVGNFPGLPH